MTAQLYPLAQGPHPRRPTRTRFTRAGTIAFPPATADTRSSRHDSRLAEVPSALPHPSAAGALLVVFASHGRWRRRCRVFVGGCGRWRAAWRVMALSHVWSNVAAYAHASTSPPALIRARRRDRLLASSIVVALHRDQARAQGPRRRSRHRGGHWPGAQCAFSGFAVGVGLSSGASSCADSFLFRANWGAPGHRGGLSRWCSSPSCRSLAVPDRTSAGRIPSRPHRRGQRGPLGHARPHGVMKRRSLVLLPCSRWCRSRAFSLHILAVADVEHPPRAPPRPPGWDLTAQGFPRPRRQPGVRGGGIPRATAARSSTSGARWALYDFTARWAGRSRRTRGGEHRRPRQGFDRQNIHRGDAPRPALARAAVSPRLRQWGARWWCSTCSGGPHPRATGRASSAASARRSVTDEQASSPGRPTTSAVASFIPRPRGISSSC